MSRNIDLSIFNKIDSIEKIDIVDAMIPVGKKDGIVKYIKRVGIKIKIDFSKNVEWLKNLGDDFLVNIEDTFYSKNGAEFHYDYGNNSNDYNSNLRSDVESGHIIIYIK